MAERDVRGIAAELAEHGVALVDGIEEPTGLLRLARSLATVVPHRDSGPGGVTILADLGRPVPPRSGLSGFSACALNPHTDRSGLAQPPGLLLMSCGQAATGGGESILIDGRAVYDDLAQRQPEAVASLSTPRSVLFGGAAGYLGSVFTVASRGVVAVRLRLDDLAQFSPEVQRWLPDLRASIDRHTIVVTLAAGEGYVVNNRHWLRGRRAFIGQRVMYRVNGNLLSHLAIPPGFRPPSSVGTAVG